MPEVIEVSNEKLVEAIAEMRKNFCTKTQNDVINIALKSVFLVPAQVTKNTGLVADADNHVKFENNQQVKFLLVNHAERGQFFPVFTDADEIQKMRENLPEGGEFQNFTMKFSDIAQLTEETAAVNGFVINPFDQNLPFTKEMLESIKQTIIKTQEARKKAAEDMHNPTVEMNGTLKEDESETKE